MDDNPKPVAIPTGRSQLALSSAQRRLSMQTEEQEALALSKAEDLADKLWERMGAMYGYTFLRQFGETPDNTWVRCLKGITGQQIAEGLERALEKHPEWPPAAAQFRALCLNIQTDDKGKELACRAGIYSTEPTESMLERRRLALESDEIKDRRKNTAKNTLNNLMGMFDGDDNESK